MRIFNFGSINIDHVYRVGHFVQPGETLGVSSYQRFLGGKGANQSLALARAGAAVSHVGAVDVDSQWAVDYLQHDGVDSQWIATADTPTGHAIIQVDDSGENCILIDAGANATLDEQRVATVLASADPTDWVLLQNETSAVAATARLAADKGLPVAYNPAPFDADAVTAVLPHVRLLIVNGTEFEALSKTLEDALPSHLDLLITHGDVGAELRYDGEQIFVPALKVNAVDTTGAGDTFIGYYLASQLAGLDKVSSLERAAAASALCVSRAGAAESIPHAADVAKLLS